MARPRLKIDWEEVGRMCEAHNTKTDIAHILQISTDSLDRACSREMKMSFASFADKKESITRNMLRRAMLEKAKNGDNVMLIWLSKNILGMKDQIETKQQVTVTEKVYKAEWGNAQEQAEKTKE